MDRGIRRTQTRRVAVRRREGLLRVWDLASELPPAHRYAKRHALGCRCSKRRAGRPRVSKGRCGERSHIYAGRLKARALRELTGYREVDWEADDVARLE